MTSERKAAANRANAARSTGPRTEAGKAAVSLNRVTHGLLAREALLPGGMEDPAEFDTLRLRLQEDLRPTGAMEELLAEQIAAGLWRLRRAYRMEAGLMGGQILDTRLSPGMMDLLSDKDDLRDNDPSVRWGSAYIRGSEYLERWIRYESSIRRGLSSALHELQRLQAARAGEAVPPPEVLDISAEFAAPGE